MGLLCYKIICSGFLNVPLADGMLLKVSPEGHHIFDRLLYSIASKRSGCDARELGLITQRSFLVVILIFRVPEVFAHDDTAEQSTLEETLEGTLCGTPQVTQ